jgi:hypothetical protein
MRGVLEGLMRDFLVIGDWISFYFFYQCIEYIRQIVTVGPQHLHDQSFQFDLENLW